MSNRIAFFGDAEDLIETFDLKKPGEAIFDAHYNISRGHHIPVITKDDDNFSISRLRWGKDFEKNAKVPEKADSDSIERLEAESAGRVVIPMSGFYIWKDEANKDHPFFVRKIDNTLLYGAAYIFQDGKKKFTYAELIMGDSNTLIQPIAETMPVILKHELAKDWMRNKIEAKDILKAAESQFIITELTVHRVTKKVKDLSKNDAALIQPIPK
ncbi:SOS response-associated peptidase [soil metagenome]